MVLAGVVGVAGSARAADDVGNHPRVAIVDFDARPGGWTLPPPQLGTTVAQLLLDKLVGVAPYHLLDGRWLRTGERPRDPGVVSEELRTHARNASVDYLVLGSVTRFSAEERHRGVGGAGFHVPLLGGYRRQTTDLVVSIMVSMVDVRTGEVVATATGEGNGTRRSIRLGAVGLLRAAGGGVSSGSSSSRDAQLDEAVHQAVAAAAQGLVNLAPRVERAPAEPHQ
jgi:curli biogenesis system outer membrane secretion channel CsgG